jgi:two-component system CheB/CheR fusion protein
VKSLVELHGGDVIARSAGPGQGSEFIVRLPAAAAAALQPLIDAPRRPAKPDTPLRILVVDDNADAAESLARLLGSWGHCVHTAHDGLEAIDEAATFLPDVILLDLGLPRLDGLEVARRLRKDPVHQSTLLLAVTGFGQSDDHRRSVAAGFDHHLVKPIDPQALRLLLLEFSRRACARSKHDESPRIVQSHRPGA